MTENKKFSTRDIYLAATLITNGFYLSGIDYQIEGSSRMPIGYFKFEDNEDLRKMEMAYIQGNLTVEPKLFANNIKTLKAQTTNFYKSPVNN